MKNETQDKRIDWAKVFFILLFTIQIIFLIWVIFFNDTRYEHSAEDREYGKAMYYGGGWH